MSACLAMQVQVLRGEEMACCRFDAEELSCQEQKEEGMATQRIFAF